MVNYTRILEELRAEHQRLCESIAALERLELNRRPPRITSRGTETPGMSKAEVVFMGQAKSVMAAAKVGRMEMVHEAGSRE